MLTRDYIYLADPAGTVMRVDSLKACVLSTPSDYASEGRRSRETRSLIICLIASSGVSVCSETTEKAGRALMEMLKRKNSAIDTNQGRVMPEGEFEDYEDSLERENNSH